MFHPKQVTIWNHYKAFHHVSPQLSVQQVHSSVAGLQYKYVQSYK